MRSGRSIGQGLLLCLSFAVVGCGRESEGPYASVSILLTDAPGPEIQSALVTISEIHLQGEDRFVLSRTPTTVDLLSLGNAALPLVDGAIVPADAFGDLRFVIDGAAIVVQEPSGDQRLYATPGYAGVPPGRPVDGVLRMPSGGGGLKVEVDETEMLVAGEQRTLLVDFDVAESFGREAEDVGWVMHPVLRAADLKATASVDVVVRVPEPDAVRRIATTGDLRARLVDRRGGLEGILVLQDQNADGEFDGSFKYVDPSEGPFSMVIDGPAGLTVTTEPNVGEDLQIGAGGAARASFTLTDVSPVPE